MPKAKLKTHNRKRKSEANSTTVGNVSPEPGPSRSRRLDTQVEIQVEQEERDQNVGMHQLSRQVEPSLRQVSNIEDRNDQEGQFNHGNPSDQHPSLLQSHPQHYWPVQKARRSRAYRPGFHNRQERAVNHVEGVFLGAVVVPTSNASDSRNQIVQVSQDSSVDLVEGQVITTNDQIVPVVQNQNEPGRHSQVENRPSQLRIVPHHSVPRITGQRANSTRYGGVGGGRVGSSHNSRADSQEVIQVEDEESQEGGGGGGGHFGGGRRQHQYNNTRDSDGYEEAMIVPPAEGNRRRGMSRGRRLHRRRGSQREIRIRSQASQIDVPGGVVRRVVNERNNSRPREGIVIDMLGQRRDRRGGARSEPRWRMEGHRTVQPESGKNLSVKSAERRGHRMRKVENGTRLRRYNSPHENPDHWQLIRRDRLDFDGYELQQFRLNLNAERMRERDAIGSELATLEFKDRIKTQFDVVCTSCGFINKPSNTLDWKEGNYLGTDDEEIQRVFNSSIGFFGSGKICKNCWQKVKSGEYPEFNCYARNCPEDMLENEANNRANPDDEDDDDDVNDIDDGDNDDIESELDEEDQMDSADEAFLDDNNEHVIQLLQPLTQDQEQQILDAIVIDEDNEAVEEEEHIGIEPLNTPTMSQLLDLELAEQPSPPSRFRILDLQNDIGFLEYTFGGRRIRPNSRQSSSIQSNAGGDAHNSQNQYIESQQLSDVDLNEVLYHAQYNPELSSASSVELSLLQPISPLRLITTTGQNCGSILGDLIFTPISTVDVDTQEAIRQASLPRNKSDALTIINIPAPVPTLNRKYCPRKVENLAHEIVDHFYNFGFQVFLNQAYLQDAQFLIGETESELQIYTDRVTRGENVQGLVELIPDPPVLHFDYGKQNPCRFIIYNPNSPWSLTMTQFLSAFAIVFHTINTPSAMTFRKTLKFHLLSGEPGRVAMKNEQFVLTSYLLCLVNDIIRLRQFDKMFKGLRVSYREYLREQSERVNERIDRGDIPLNSLYYRNGKRYWGDVSRNILEMCEIYGPPLLFFTFTSDEMNWDSVLENILLYHGSQVDLSFGRKTITKENVKYWLFLLTNEDRQKLLNCDPGIVVKHFEMRVAEFIRLMVKRRVPFGFKHELFKYFIRVEFSNDGKMHIHGVSWHRNVPVLQTLDPTLCRRPINLNELEEEEEQDQINMRELLEFVDEYMTTEPRRFQMHDHSCSRFQTCDRSNRNLEALYGCRQNCPCLPMPKSMIIRPIKDVVSRAQRKVLNRRLRAVREYLRCTPQVTLNNMTFLQFLNQLNLTEGQYFRVVQYSELFTTVLLKRDVGNCMVNQYLKFGPDIWEARSDAKVIAGYQEVVSYICKQPPKGQIPRMIRLLTNLTTRGNCPLLSRQIDEATELMKIDGNSLCTSIHEALYILMGLPLFRCSDGHVFQSTKERSTRVGVRKRADLLLGLDPDDTNIMKHSFIDHYMARPAEWRDRCLAQVASTSHYVGQRSGKNCYKCIDPHPGFLKSNKPKIVVTEKRLDHTTANWYRQQLLLYVPFENEVEHVDLDDEALAAKYHVNREEIDRNEAYYLSLINPPYVYQPNRLPNNL